MIPFVVVAVLDLCTFPARPFGAGCLLPGSSVQAVKDYVEASGWAQHLKVECVPTLSCTSAGDVMRELDQMGVIESDPFILISGDVVANIDLKPFIAVTTAAPQTKPLLHRFLSAPPSRLLLIHSIVPRVMEGSQRTRSTRQADVLHAASRRCRLTRRVASSGPRTS